MHRLFLDLTDSVQLSEQELDQLRLVLLWDLRKAIDNDERIQALLEVNLELLSQICAYSQRRPDWPLISNAPEKSNSSSSSLL